MTSGDGNRHHKQDGWDRAQRDYDNQVARIAAGHPGQEWVPAPHPVKGWVRVEVPELDGWDLL